MPKKLHWIGNAGGTRTHRRTHNRIPLKGVRLQATLKRDVGRAIVKIDGEWFYLEYRSDDTTGDSMWMNG